MRRGQGRLVAGGAVVLGGGYCGSVLVSVRLGGRDSGAVVAAEVLRGGDGGLVWGASVVVRGGGGLLVGKGLVGGRVGHTDAAGVGAVGRAAADAGAVRLGVAAGEGRADAGGVRDAADVAAEPAAEAERHVRRAPDSEYRQEVVTC